MSTTSLKFSIYFAVCSAFLFSGVSAQQRFGAKVKIDALVSSEPIVTIEGELARESRSEANRNWSFADSSAGAENLGERISGFDLSDREGRKISVKRFSASEYLADGAAANWIYKINLSAAQNSIAPNFNARAHVSWLENERGILMLGDLLPQFSSRENKLISARIEFDLPKDWRIITNETKTAENVFTVENVGTAIFLVGKNWRENKIVLGKSELNLALAGDWQFSDGEARRITGEIYGEYEEMFGESAAGKIQIALARFPANVKFGRWAAEMRGANLTVLSADMPFKAQSLQLLHEQLRHELFHLWIPNRLALTGNYDWFYEGFAVYQSLKIGVAANRIRFEDFLATLAQAYDLNGRRAPNASLIEESKNRRSGASGSQAYARGMIVAFLCDVALIKASGGKRQISSVIKEIYQKHRFPNQTRDGSAAILETFERHAELDAVVGKYIKGVEVVDWAKDLESIGIDSMPENSFTRLNVRDKPNRRQKDILNRLGYNNWRKLSEKQK